jgi:hypothetical protein
MLRYPYGSVIAEIGVNERAVIAGQTLVIALYPVWRLVRLADGGNIRNTGGDLAA